MKVHVFECEMLSPLSLQETFAVFENPYNLARITPPWLNFSILTEGVQMRKDAEIDYRIRWMGIPLRWHTRITEYEPPFLFVDEMMRGPYSLWRHRHTFRPSPNGTVVADRVEYALPLGPIGNLVQRLTVGAQVAEIFSYRQKALKEIFLEQRLKPRQQAATSSLPRL